ncbi:TPA: hypothetical protein ACHH3Q_000872 [Streptococcus pyogenes]|uniref:hypothetical protein n=1 Tax=Streptococcus pyogenes TaxID=1314 RepID=UPI000971CE44|nr:hypothetical protein [Streptococcus pyogenes]HER4625691.1 hypothetical protein [Streptococcus pyogenes NGAS604]HER4674656.1 hypothetical protein [Streptococcus pyogenes NGAS344]ARV01975.1 hypothetical protein AYM92_08830 [Streptococcus pyogenes]ASQ21948.1 hypothetical protein B4W66_08750 [Streptococcus pyogenes]ASQ23757.1 hypothetical protein B5D85_09100 [Streptococcus pyogenes]
MTHRFFLTPLSTLWRRLRPKRYSKKVLATDEPTGYQPPAAHGPCDDTHQLLEDKSLSDDYLIATSAMRHLWYWGYSQIG